jgi:hypothetical protein
VAGPRGQVAVEVVAVVPAVGLDADVLRLESGQGGRERGRNLERLLQARQDQVADKGFFVAEDAAEGELLEGLQEQRGELERLLVRDIEQVSDASGAELVVQDDIRRGTAARLLSCASATGNLATAWGLPTDHPTALLRCS